MKNGKKILIGTTIVVFIGAIGLTFMMLKDKIKQIKSRKKIKFTRDGESSFGGSTSVDIKVPLVNKKFYPDSSRKQTKAKMDSIYAKYKSIIDNIAKINQFPTELITSIIFIESGGNETAVSSSGATGLMQVSPNGINDMIFIEKKKSNITQAELDIMKKYLTADEYNKVVKGKFGDVAISKARASKLFKIPEFNIMIGTMHFGQCLEKTKENGKYRVDKAFVMYNRGYYTKIESGLTPTQLTEVKSMPAESKNYILKIGGVNGTLDVMNV